MKILAFVDMHGSKEALRKIKSTARKENVDYVVCAGDITIFGDEFEKLMKQLDEMGKTVLMVHGNHEGQEETRKLCEKSKNIVFLHKRVLDVGDYVFVGWGGGGFSKSDKQFENFIKKELPNIKKGKKILLVTHAPPHKTKLDDIWGEPAGCKSIRNFIEEHKPHTAISGHLHENSGKVDNIGKTMLINPGPWGIVIEI